ncbi:ImmA/IrrE family metallo-endopeptidase [Archangium violaceum]|uniref:XRE family transcriptional regulator n=1 Tax=Archangium violaceum TaxID=83451 RepID=UPI00194FEBC5|nr:XRE family transcriptional regulator [Archangium violaceum]QRN97415.1 ImmA/IrrE family metallo-endopeptidase [Archangium violaceum]
MRTRLIEAREARGLTQLALADQVTGLTQEVTRLTRSGIASFELGDSTPRPETLTRIATVLGLPERYFFWPDNAPKPSTTFCRAPRSVSPILSTRADRQAKWAGDVASELSGVMGLQKVDFPKFDIPNPEALTGERIEELATQVRRYWGLGDGPISNVVKLLENKGAIVVRCELGEPRLDGLSHWRGERPTIMLAADRGSGARSRFDAAHELGHLILHRAVPAERLRNGADWRLFEDQAHRFAGAFLFPQSAFMEEVLLVDLDALQPLKLRWKVSIKMMVKRAATLGLIPPERERHLMVNYNRRGYRLNEPFENAVEVEKPRLLKLAIELLVNGRGPDAALDLLPYPLSDLERLTGISPNLFSKNHGAVVSDVIVLSFKTPSEPPSEPTPTRHERGTLGEIVPFPRR